MPRRYRKTRKLYPRSFLASPDLDAILLKVARQRGMTRSQLIRHALTEWLFYHHVEESAALRKKAGRDADQTATAK